MTTNAADVITRMRRTCEVGMLVAISMTAKAALVGLRHAQVFEDNDLALVASAFHVCRPRTMACFAIHPLTRGTGLKSHLVMGRLFCRFVDIFVTSLAGFRTHVLPGILGLTCRTGVRRALFHILRLHVTDGYQQEGEE